MSPRPPASNAAVARPRRGAQSATMLSLESRVLCRRGSIIGTAMMPARRQPKNATIKSMPLENSSKAPSPGAAPLARRGRPDEPRRHRAGAPLELPEGDARILAATVGKQDVGGIVRLLGGA